MIQAAPSHAFADQHPLVLGKGALDVQQQLGLRTIAQTRLIEEDHRHRRLAQFVQHHLLRTQVARQAIRTQTQQGR
jgi:hypothetical protein